MWKTDLFSKWQSDLPAKRQSSSKQKGMMTASSNLYTLVVGIYSMPWMSNGLVRSKRRRETTPRHNGLLEKVYVVTWSTWSHFQFLNVIWRHFSIKLDIWMICKLLCSKNHLEDVKYHCWCCIYSQIKSKLICKVRKNLCWVCKKPPALFQNPTTFSFFKVFAPDWTTVLLFPLLCLSEQTAAASKWQGGRGILALYALSPFNIQKGTKPAVWPLFSESIIMGTDTAGLLLHILH